MLTCDRAHQLMSNGTYGLLYGTEHGLLGSTPGLIEQIITKWQLGGIMNFNSGAPLSLTTAADNIPTFAPGVCSTTSGTQTMSNVQAQANVVGALPKDMRKVTKISKG